VGDLFTAFHRFEQEPAAVPSPGIDVKGRDIRQRQFCTERNDQRFWLVFYYGQEFIQSKIQVQFILFYSLFQSTGITIPSAAKESREIWIEYLNHP
jgi:hypothetical protein